jgi:hypothetical protein
VPPQGSEYAFGWMFHRRDHEDDVDKKGEVVYDATCNNKITRYQDLGESVVGAGTGAWLLWRASWAAHKLERPIVDY